MQYNTDIAYYHLKNPALARFPPTNSKFLLLYANSKNQTEENNKSYKTTQERRALFVAQLNQLELQNLRHLIGFHETASQKLQAYSQQASDPQVKQMFERSAQEARNTKQKLMSFLS